MGLVWNYIIYQEWKWQSNYYNPNNISFLRYPWPKIDKFTLFDSTPRIVGLLLLMNISSNNQIQFTAYHRPTAGSVVNRTRLQPLSVGLHVLEYAYGQTFAYGWGNHYSRSSRSNSRIPIAKAYISGEFCWIYLGCLYTRPRLKKQSRKKPVNTLRELRLRMLRTALTLRLVSSARTTSLYFQPTSWLRRPRWQKERPGLRHITRIAVGTTSRLRLSYGGGQPSNALNLFSASFPRFVLCGIMPGNNIVWTYIDYTLTKSIKANIRKNVTSFAT